MRERGWRLGPHVYVPVAPLALQPPSGDCTWALVRRDGAGPRTLLQLWEPCPPGPVLDRLREEFLQCAPRSETLDAGSCHLGFDRGRAWFLQELGGTPLLRLWAQADAPGREQLAARIEADAMASRVPRLLLPEVIGIEPGRVLAPRILGVPEHAPEGGGALMARMPQAPPEPGNPERLWDEQPEFTDASWLPLRGRARELTYLKSLMLGLGAAIPMERVLLLQGEEGLGHDRLCDWAAAAAETEGIWVANLDIYPGEGSGGLLERLLAELLAGLEADLYSALPEVARGLSRRLATFAFLHGGRRTAARDPEPKELAAALEAMAFAQARHPRLVLIRGLERAVPEIPGMLRELVLGSALPWVLSARDAGRTPESRACLVALAHHPASATVLLERLEDGPIAEVLADLLGPHDLPAAFLAQVVAASLGNPGLLQKTLELAQAQGLIQRREGRWACAPGGVAALALPDDLRADLLRGRLLRLRPDARGAVNHLALADGPLPFRTLGRALALDGDALEEALHPAVNAKLALVVDGSAGIAGPAVRELVMARMSAREIRTGAQVLLKAMGEGGGSPLLAVRLQAFALDRGAALAKVLEGVEQARSGPLEAGRILGEALKLGPGPAQEARLWEFQADAWGRANAGDGLGGTGEGAEAPLEQALAALERAIRVLEGAETAPREDLEARLWRKRGLLEMRLGRLERAAESFRCATALLVDHPFHPEQPRLRLAAGRLQLLRGEWDAAVASLRAGMNLLVQKGAEQREQTELRLELGRALSAGAQFQGALACLDPVQRLAEHDGDRHTLALALDAVGQIRLAMGQPDPAGECMQEALALARATDDQTLVAHCQLHLGIFRSCRQLLGPAQASLDSALRRFKLLGDGPAAARVLAWKARNLTALADPGQAEHLLLRVAGAGPGAPVVLGERAFLDGESAGFLEAWGAARRHYQAAANRQAHAGQLWHEQLSRLRCIQAEAQEAGDLEPILEPAWTRLEQLKPAVAAAGSRWLELEWHRAHALLLSSGGSWTDLAEALMAWGEVVSAARALRFPAVVLEAATRSSELLLERGERLGARIRIQDALPSAHELWNHLPPERAAAFLGRNDLRRFQGAAASAGLSLAWPEAQAPAPDWNPTTIDLSLVPSCRLDP